MINIIGKSIGRYHILEQLGEGGMATVYKAFDTRLERDVAIKIIHPVRQYTPKFLKRFEREAKALAQLSHPNIVKVLDYGEYDGLPYIVMEYFPGGTLKDKLGKPMPWQKAAKLLAPIAQALEYAHQCNIIHRDVKPANILISDSGQAMLSDFGIAKVLELEETVDLTGTGVGIGTPEYMAPEQGLGKTVDHRADIYALGVVFYELVTGRKPFKADTPMAVVIKHIHEPLLRPKSFVQGLPNCVERVLFKALMKEPQNRFRTMSQFAVALEKLATGEKMSMPGKRKKLRWSFIAVGTVLGLVLVTALFAWMNEFYPFPAQIDEEARVNKKVSQIEETKTLLSVPIVNRTQTPTKTIATSTIILSATDTQPAETNSVTPTIEPGRNSNMESDEDTYSSTMSAYRTKIATDKPSTPDQVAVVIVEQVNIRSGPGTVYSILESLSLDDELALIGRDQDETWVVVKISNGENGWISIENLETEANISQLPIIETPPTPAPALGSVTVNNNLGKNVLIAIGGGSYYLSSGASQTYKIFQGTQSYRVCLYEGIDSMPNCGNSLPITVGESTTLNLSSLGSLGISP